MKRLAVFMSVALAGFAAAAVSAAPTPLAPTATTDTTAMFPVFHWRLPSTEVSESVGVATSPALGSTGEFVASNIVVLDAVQPDATSYKFDQALAAGKYWWHVASHDTAAQTGHLFSAPQAFTIRPSVTKLTLKVQVFGRSFLSTSHWLANVGTVNVLEKLMNGRKTVASKQTKASAILGQSGLDVSDFNVPSTVKSGTTLRFTVTIAVPGSTVKATSTKTIKVH